MFKFLTLSISIVLSMHALAQKKCITTNDFADWNRIENREISNNGAYISYELNKQKGDGSLIWYTLQTKKNDTIPLGKHAKFSPNSDFIAFNITLPTDSVRKLKLAKTPADKMPKDSLAVYAFNQNLWFKYAQVSSFKVANEKSSWIAIAAEPKEQKADTTAADSVKNNSSSKIKSNKKNKKTELKQLILINPTTSQQFIFERVEEYTIAHEGKTIAFTTKINDTAKVYALVAFNTLLAKADTLFTDSMTLKKITLDKPGNQLAMLASADTAKEKVFAVYYFNLNKPQPLLVVDTATIGIPTNWAPSEHGNLFFSDDATKLFLGASPKPKPTVTDSILEEEKPKLDIWSWTDKELQPMQLKNLEKTKKQTYLGVYHIKPKTYVQLADTVVESVSLINNNNGTLALGSNDNPYKRATSWTGLQLNDYYLIDVITGKKNKVLTAQENASLSPDGTYVIWYNANDSSYYCLNSKTAKITGLTKNIPVPFFNELNDVPANPSPYGIAGWAEGDKFLFIYDRYDIWKIDPSDKLPAINITQSFGRKNKIKLRYQKLDDEQLFIPLHENIILEATNELNFKEGWYGTTLNTPETPKLLFEGDFRLHNLKKAKLAERVIWSTETVSQYPEIKVSTLDFADVQTITQANPQQKDFNWATTEIVEWRSFTNDTLKGILYKPENFDPTKKYPMVVYFYERSTQDIHFHFIPYPSHSIINKTFYASNGYLVFVPDITYTAGYPGQDAYNAIVSGVNKLITTCPYVDSDKIGLQGQSWGGYQIAYLITQTNMFAAAMAGAPVSNMTSAYGGIRWESGMSRMFQYEQEQSRIGGTLWEKTLQYIENSPVFYAPKVTTPLLIMHNDNDGAVPWYQGIEYFMALRRLDKPVWMLNYNGMNHNIESKYWANRMDLSIRMMQFFDHYLKDAPAPDWMLNGLPAIDKGENLGY